MDSETTATFFALLLFGGGLALAAVAVVGGPLRSAVRAYGVPLAFFIGEVVENTTRIVYHRRGV